MKSIINETDIDKLKYEMYFSTVFKTRGMPTPDETLSYYDRAFGWCLPLGRDSAVLDFGAGMGNLIYWLKSRGFKEVAGIDISVEQCNMAKKINNIDVVHCQSPLDYLEEHDETYGVVVMSDVLEHIPKAEMINYLSSIHNSLLPGGCLIIKTDNVSSPTGIYQQYMDFTHEYTFVEDSLAQLLRICGFSDVRIKGEPIPWPRRPWLWWQPIVRHLYWWILRVVYEAEQPRSNNPSIFSKSLIACCRKPLD